MARDIYLDLYPSEVLYDVKNKAFLTGRSRYNGQNDEEKANMQAGDDEEDINQIKRSITTAMNGLLPKLAEYLPQYGEKIITLAGQDLSQERKFRPYVNVPEGDASASHLTATDLGAPGSHYFNNKIFEEPSGSKPVVLHLSVPSNFNDSVTPTLITEVHQYIVNKAIFDWFVITDKADAADYDNLATQNLANIREAINKRVRPQRTSTFN